MGEIGPHHRRVSFQYGRVVRHHLHECRGVHRRRRYGSGQRTLRLTAVASFADAAASRGSARGSCEHASLAPSTKESLLNQSVNSPTTSTHPLPSDSSRRLRGGDTVFKSSVCSGQPIHLCLYLGSAFLFPWSHPLAVLVSIGVERDVDDRESVWETY